MKKKLTLLILLALLLLPPLLVTRPFFWRFVVKEIEGALQKEGVAWRIEQVRGTPLSTLILEGVEVEVKGETLKLKRLSTKLSLPALLQGELKLYEMKGEGLHLSHWVEGGEVEGELSLSKRHERGHLKIVQGDETLRLRFETKEFRKGDVRLSLVSSRVGKEPLIATFHFEREESGNWDLSPIRLQTPWGKGKGALSLFPSGVQGDLQLANIPFKVQGRWDSKELLFSLQGPRIEGGLHIASLDQLYGNLSIGDLSSLQPLFPNLPLGGSLKGCGEKQGEALQLDLALTSFYAGPFEAEQLTFSKELQGPSRLELSEGRFKKLFLHCALFELTHNSLFTLFAKGGYPTPFSLEAEGAWEGDLSAFVATLNTLDGTVGEYPLHLTSPASLSYAPHLLLLSPLSLELGNGEIALSLHRGELEGGCHLSLEELPLELVGSPFAGKGALTLDLSEKRGEPLQGAFRGGIAPCEPLAASARMEGSLGQRTAHTQATLFLKEAKWFEVDLTLPLELSLLSPHAHLSLDRPLDASFFCDGRIDELLELFNLGAHRLEGVCQGEFRLKGSLAKPELTGLCHLEQGTYENYVTGTELHNIDASLTAEKGRLFLTSLTAQDACCKGSFEAVGSIALKPAQKFPFSFDLSFQNLLSVQIDLVTAETSGKIHLTGDLDGAHAKGELTVVNTDLVIPSHIPKPLPILQVTYLHGKEPPLPSPRSHLYPISLDLRVTAPEKVEISGRGLNSTWRGDFQVGGSYTAPAAEGKLELVQGTFLFSGRTFKLTEGSLSLSGKEGEMPWINLAGTMSEKGVSLIARLKGPLNAPQLTFQSVPPLPLSGILSYLLFGQDLSEINAFQAIELANTVASLSNDGSDVLENTRRSLGIDRLRVIASTNAEGDDAVAIQVGKYVAEGVIVSFTQGNDLSDISIEVDLSHGFVFQAETQQEQEQGKFTIKWNLNY